MSRSNAAPRSRLNGYVRWPALAREVTHGLGVSLLLSTAACVTIVPVVEGGTGDTGDTGESSPAGDTTAGPDAMESLDDDLSTGCDGDECETESDPSTSTTGGTDSVPPPGPSYCRSPFINADPGQTVLVDSLTLEDGGMVTDMHVLVRVTHHQVGALQIVLSHEDTHVALLEPTDCDGAHIDAIFDEDAETEAIDTCSSDESAVFGAVIPAGDFAPFMSQSAAGPWDLTVTQVETPTELASFSLDSWCLALATTESAR